MCFSTYYRSFSNWPEISDSEIGELLSEGKTKQVFKINKQNEFKDQLVYIISKDNISAGMTSLIFIKEYSFK